MNANLPIGYRALGFQQLSAISAAKGVNLPAGATLALIQCETNAVRWRDDGPAPTATVGYPLPVGSELSYDGNGWEMLQFIPQTGSATVDIVYYGP